MLSRINQKSSGSNTVFYVVPSKEKQTSGYLLKSPPLSRFRSYKSWKRRYFELSQMSENGHVLKYYKSKEERDKISGEIDISQITLIYLSPVNHGKWNWIQKTFRCSSDMVLFARVSDRDYFFIGESKEDVDRWYNAIFNVLKSKSEQEHWSPEKLEKLTERTNWPSRGSFGDEDSLEDPDGAFVPFHPTQSKARSISEPIMRRTYISEHYECPVCILEKNIEDKCPKSEPVSIESHYDVPRNLKSEAKDIETREDNVSSLYMEMDSVFEAAKQIQMNLSIAPSSSCPVDKEESNDNLSTKVTSACQELESHSNSINGDQQLQTESFEEITLVEKDVYVTQNDLKNYLTLTEVDGIPCIANWPGLPITECLFHKGDQILAVNDLQTQSVEEVQLYLSKLMKAEVKITIRREPGSQAFHSEACPCD
ncbi:pleckstrin homology domain-containing family S member 1 isoform X2 [Amia ocellicauda]|uniref:pleckstrin homology domain-containing family S member 1 isoform X2 n=1 Tax=Amia ocellicauda TaxID=2972642 RepID=UPI003464A921